MPANPNGVAVISGAGSGLGREVALALGRRGHPLALLGRRVALLESTLDLAGGAGAAYACDVRDPQAVERAAAGLLERFGPPEVVVPAAGTALVAPVEGTTPAAFEEIVGTNLTGVFTLVRALLPSMRRNGRGWLFPILSVAARRGFPNWSAYCASKWGLAGLVASLREELAGTGVRITALYPGATDTPIWDSLPGTWDRSIMIPATEVARAVAYALDADDAASVEEIHWNPSAGAQ
jgi:NAD(P)-dependent dehydrogenase (short-subunit alcohol dehydrogenase family)